MKSSVGRWVVGILLRVLTDSEMGNKLRSLKGNDTSGHENHSCGSNSTRQVPFIRSLSVILP